MQNNINILQIDVEDWYCDLDIKQWKNHENRVVQNTDKILAMLKKEKAKATFFMLGYVAERSPQLVEKIVKEGHEIASHGYNHKPLTKQTPEEFEKDLLKSIKILKAVTGEEIWGYRAPQFTVVKKTSWAIDILKKNGLKYDSSIFPVKTPLYGVADAPLYPYRISSANIKKDNPNEKFLEFPLSVYEIPIIKKNMPIAGGFYLRFFPYCFISYALRKINRKDRSAICYLHPWELDPLSPRINGLKWYNYYRLKGTERKFKKLLEDFKFTSTKEFIQIYERG